MIERLKDLVNANASLVRRGRWTDVTMLLEVGKTGWLIEIRAGRIESMTRQEMQVAQWDFAIRGPEDAWRKFWSAPPPPMHHDLHALVRAGHMRLEGNFDLLQANLLYLKILLETLRGRV